LRDRACRFGIISLERIVYDDQVGSASRDSACDRFVARRQPPAVVLNSSTACRSGDSRVERSTDKRTAHEGEGKPRQFIRQDFAIADIRVFLWLACGQEQTVGNATEPQSISGGAAEGLMMEALDLAATHRLKFFGHHLDCAS